MDEFERRRAVAERAARAGAAVAHRSFRGTLAVDTKDGKTDVVTEADRAAQRRVVSVIDETFPDEAVVGEENDQLRAVPESGPAWLVDPIDGTNNFVRDVQVWSTSVAAVIDGEPVAAASVLPALGDAYVSGPGSVVLNGDATVVSDVADPERATVAPTFWWDFDHREEYARACRAIVHRFGDMRRFGCAQATLGMVAAGSLEGTLTDERANPWDTVAGVHMVRQAGGTVTDLAGERWRHDSQGLVASNGTVHDDVLAAAREIRELDD